MPYAPIAIFCYNRPNHLKKTVETLMRCPGIEQSTVFIFQDGPKNQLSSELKNFNKVGDFIQNVSIGRNKMVNRSNVNKGLANSIKDGIDFVLENHDRIIVIEDDLELSPGFLSYMNSALGRYENQDEVMHVSGYMFPIEISDSTFFLNYTSCWGWGTWKNAWQKLEWDCLYLYKNLVEKNKWSHFTLNGKNGNKAQLLGNIHGNMETWAIRWQGTIELNNGFCLHPNKSLVRNIGFDGTGENCPAEHTKYEHLQLAETVLVGPIKREELIEAKTKLQHFYEHDDIGLIQKIKTNKKINKLIDLTPRKLISKLKGKKSESFDESKLKDLQRFEPFNIKALNFDIAGCDNASFLSMWQEIFVKEIYNFQPKNDDPIILDIGANIGLSALFFASHFPSARIEAYEADPEIFHYLSQNIQNNGIENIKAFNRAVWENDDMLSFSNNGGDAGLISSNQNTKNSISIQAISFKSVIDNFSQRIDLLKMDIEGAEVETVLSYPEGLLKIDHLFIEYHSFKREPQKLNELLSTISESGFRYSLFNVYDEMPKSPFINRNKYGEMDLQVNIFAYRD